MLHLLVMVNYLEEQIMKEDIVTLDHNKNAK
jgi:hypothetical protein